eukprot:s25_g4.t2
MSRARRLLRRGLLEPAARGQGRGAPWQSGDATEVGNTEVALKEFCRQQLWQQALQKLFEAPPQNVLAWGNVIGAAFLHCDGILNRGLVQESVDLLKDTNFKVDHDYQTQRDPATGNLLVVTKREDTRMKWHCQICLCLAVVLICLALLAWLTQVPFMRFGGSDDAGFDAMEHDCDKDRELWKTDWVEEKKEFCCEKVSVGCLFNCHVGSPAEWQWCCEQFQVGCAPGVPGAPGAQPAVPRPLPVRPIGHQVAVPVPTVHRVSHYYYHSDDWHAPDVQHIYRPYHCYQNAHSWMSTWNYCCKRHSVFCGGAISGEVLHDVVTHPAAVHHVVHHVVHHSGGSAIPHCGLSDNNCPDDWNNKPTGGYHCKHKLTRQTSQTAYEESGGACRPVKLGPFPDEDCHDQCYVGMAKPSGGAGSFYHDGSSHHHGGSYYHDGSYYHHGADSSFGLDGSYEGGSSYTYHEGGPSYSHSYGGTYHDSGLHDGGYYHGSSYTMGGHGGSSYSMGGSYHHGGSSYYQHGGHYSYHSSGGHSYKLGGHYNMRGSYGAHHIPACAGADHRCPAEWLSGATGGFHCKHKLKRQTREPFLSATVRISAPLATCTMSETAKLMQAKGSSKVATETTFLSALAQGLCWEAAVRHLSQMQNEGDAKPNVITFSSAIRAAEMGSAWEHVLKLLSDMPGASVKPDTIMMTSCIGASYKAAQWAQAVHLFDCLDSMGLTPDVFCFNNAIAAWSFPGHWKATLTLLQRLRLSKLQPVEDTLTSCISACGEAGLRFLHIYMRTLTVCEGGSLWEHAVHLLSSALALRPSSSELDELLQSAVTPIYNANRLAEAA